MVVDGAGAAQVAPAARLDRVGDEPDKLLLARLRGVAFSHVRVAAVRGERTAAGRRADRHAGRQAARTLHGRGCIRRRVRIGAGLKSRRAGRVRDWDDQIGHLIGLAFQLAARRRLRGDLKHFVLDDVGQVDLLQDQVQRGFERNILQFDGDGALQADGFLIEGQLIDVDVDVLPAAQVVEDLLERRVGEVERHERTELVLNLALFVGLLPRIRPVLFAAAGQLDHHWIDNKRVRVVDRRSFVFGGVQLGVEGILPVGAAFLAGGVAGLPLGEGHPGRGGHIVRVEFVGLERGALGFRPLAFLHEAIELLHQLGHLLFLVALGRHLVSGVLGRRVLAAGVGRGHVFLNLEDLELLQARFDRPTEQAHLRRVELLLVQRGQVALEQVDGGVGLADAGLGLGVALDVEAVGA